MKIKVVSEYAVVFDNGDIMTYGHKQDCCEHNYADFMSIDDLARSAVFNGPILFQSIDGSGFRFGTKNNMHFVPCYSEQNGYYSTGIDIYYNGSRVLSFGAEETIY